MENSIYTNSTHHCLVEPNKITKETVVTGAVAWRVRIVDLAFDATDLSSNLFL